MTNQTISFLLPDVAVMAMPIILIPATALLVFIAFTASPPPDGCQTSEPKKSSSEDQNDSQPSSNPEHEKIECVADGVIKSLKENRNGEWKVEGGGWICGDPRKVSNADGIAIYAWKDLKSPFSVPMGIKHASVGSVEMPRNKAESIFNLVESLGKTDDEKLRDEQLQAFYQERARERNRVIDYFCKPENKTTSGDKI